MKKLKVLTIVGTRPEIIRLSRTMALLDQYVKHWISEQFDPKDPDSFFETV
jgi:UDP-N-acetyl-L-fucosamine synthase